MIRINNPFQNSEDTTSKLTNLPRCGTNGMNVAKAT